jgi:hypothetical protein
LGIENENPNCGINQYDYSIRGRDNSETVGKNYKERSIRPWIAIKKNSDLEAGGGEMEIGMALVELTKFPWRDMNGANRRSIHASEGGEKAPMIRQSLRPGDWKRSCERVCTMYRSSFERALIKLKQKYTRALWKKAISLTRCTERDWCL